MYGGVAAKLLFLLDSRVPYQVTSHVSIIPHTFVLLQSFCFEGDHRCAGTVAIITRWGNYEDLNPLVKVVCTIYKQTMFRFVG